MNLNLSQIYNEFVKKKKKSVQENQITLSYK